VNDPPRAPEHELWSAIGEPSRRQLLDVLLQRGEASASALAADVPFTRQAVAKHLAVLDRAGLVEGRRHGREVRYSVQADRLDEATREMARVAAHWDRRLQAIKAIAEAAHRERQGQAEA
jgi:DNA-binding transcriptional ArsR family regulator